MQRDDASWEFKYLPRRVLCPPKRDALESDSSFHPASQHLQVNRRAVYAQHRNVDERQLGAFFRAFAG